MFRVINLITAGVPFLQAEQPDANDKDAARAPVKVLKRPLIRRVVAAEASRARLSARTTRTTRTNYSYEQRCSICL